MNVRFANKRDKQQVLGLLDELGEEINLKRGYSPHNAEASKVGGAMFDEILSRPDTLIFIAEDKGRLAGLITFYLLPNLRHGFYGGHIEDVVVTKSLRMKGIGTLLMNAVKKYCKDHHIKVIKLDSGRELTQAHAFYQKNGFKFTEKMFRLDLD